MESFSIVQMNIELYIDYTWQLNWGLLFVAAQNESDWPHLEPVLPAPSITQSKSDQS